MPPDNREYRILDKDLGRVSNAEHARSLSAQLTLRIGIALIVIVAVAEFFTTVVAGQPAFGITATAIAIAIYLAFSIGANDVANSLSPAVGAGAIGLTAGLFLVAIMEIAGAVIAGGAVTTTLTQGLIGNTMGDGAPTARMMLAALMAAATYISVATWLNAPISTTHSVVGAIAGAGTATFGFASVHWDALAVVAAGWVVSPLVSGFLAAALLASMHRNVLDKDDPIPTGRVWLTGLVAIASGLLGMVGSIAYGGLPWAVIAAIAAGGLFLGGVYAHYSLSRQISHEAGNGKTLKVLLGPPLIFAALIMGFAHGANDTSNIAAPLTIVLSRIGDGGAPLMPQASVLLLSGFGIAAGIVMFGGKLVRMVGSNITRLNPSRALCVTLAAAMTVLLFSSFGMPVSTTHISVGGGVRRRILSRMARPQKNQGPCADAQRRSHAPPSGAPVLCAQYPWGMADHRPGERSHRRGLGAADRALGENQRSERPAPGNVAGAPGNADRACKMHLIRLAFAAAWSSLRPSGDPLPAAEGDMHKSSVLFVCLGNICRSPLAEGAMRAAAEAEGIDIVIDSAGTGDWHVGSEPDRRAQAVAHRNGINISRIRARQVRPQDFRDFDHIVAMDDKNLADLKSVAPDGAHAALSLLMDHVPGREGQSVSDPYFGGAAGFDATWRDVQAGVQALLPKLARR